MYWYGAKSMFHETHRYTANQENASRRPIAASLGWARAATPRAKADKMPAGYTRILLTLDVSKRLSTKENTRQDKTSERRRLANQKTGRTKHHARKKRGTNQSNRTTKGCF